ncbi:MAG: PAS domain-containing protein, partial [Geobacteraceae bacterium]|nr:PAS domain-containing protein [Geobacteraceae bacterium]
MKGMGVVTVWGLLVALLLLFPWPGHAAERTGVVRYAHLSAKPKAPPADPGRAAVAESPPQAPFAAAAGQGGGAKAASQFLPHGTCLSWRPALMWTHIVSDSLIALAYYSIPVALIVLVRRRRDLQFNWMFVLFGVFIMACGTGHLLSLYNLWVPDYMTSGIVKAITAFVSVITAVILWPLIPKAVALPGPAQWEAVHSALRNEVAERAEAEAEVRRLNAGLEERVAERTAELEAANRMLAEANQGLREREAQVLESQCLLRAIIDNSTAIIYVKDLEGRYLMVNRRFEELFHVMREAVAGKTDHDLFPREQADAFRAFDQRVLAAGTVLEAEEVAPQDDGPHTYISIKAPLHDAAGNSYAICGISADITGRKRDEEEIRRLNADLERKMEELVAAEEELVRKEKLSILGQLSGSVGHELRNPLGVMSNAVYFLKMVLTDADETTREYLDIVKREIDNSQRIITDLLDFARTKTPQAQAVAARDLIHESLGRCAIPDNVALQAEIAETLPLLRVDPLQLGQVLLNFVTNAVQAMPNGGALRVSARRVLSSEFGVLSSNLEAET